MGGRDFKADLRTQLEYIDTSSQLIDQGRLNEAARVAVAVRVIFHQTSASTSLLTHLQSPNPVMIATGIPISPNVIMGESGLTRYAISESGAAIEPMLDRGPNYRQLPCDTWWTEPIVVSNNMKWTRRNVVLAAANKDGGAHVDGTLPADYEILRRGLWTVMLEGLPGRRMNGQVAFTLRQVGWEVLNSPSIRALAGL